MSRYHSLLLRQLKRLAIELDGSTPDAEQWRDFLERVSRAYTEADEGRYLIERSQHISSREMQELYRRLEEAQRIAGLGNWSWDEVEHRRLWSDECSRIFDLAPSNVTPGYRAMIKRVLPPDRAIWTAAMRGALNGGREFDIEFRVRRRSGEIRWVCAVGKPLRNEQGTITRVNGTVMDITRRKLVELRRSIEHAVTLLLAQTDAAAPTEVMPRILETMCTTLGWACAAFWQVDGMVGQLRRVSTWAVPGSRAREFFQLSGDSVLVFGCAGLIARTAQTGAPVWIADVVHDEDFRKRKPAAIACGLHAAFALPIQAGGEIVGVIELFHHEPQQADADMLQSAHVIGRQIAQYFQRTRAERALRQSEAHFRALVEQASDSFYVHDIEGRFIDVNQRGCDSLGYTRRELLGMNITQIDASLSVDDLLELQPQLAARATVALESSYRRKDGSTFPVEIRLGLIEIDGRQHLLSLVRDVTDRKQLQDHVHHLAYHDSLTGLPNRAKFNGYLSHAIAQASRYRKGLAVLFIDLDRFKNVNDTLGHNAGDRLLQEMSRRLSSCLREGDRVARLDGDDELVARLGGDEFVVLIEELADPAYAAHVARKILATLVREFALDGQRLHVTASIGISTFPEDGNDELSLMKNADIAMYRAKERGRNNYQFYSAQMNVHSFELLALESGLRRAIERDELMLQYQPKVSLRSGRIIGVEALLRWRHPELGLTLPEHFIPLAEENGLIVPIGNWVLRQACLQSRRWSAQGLAGLRIAVNLSARQFNDDNLLSDIAQILEETAMDPALLEFEITESVVMYNLDKTAQLLAGLKTMGTRVAIDDFGVGYSSLSHLKRFPIDILKIDRSFVCEIPGNAVDEAIAGAIVAMGNNLSIEVVAEGVETEEQRRFLQRHGCEQAQGYLFSEALGAEAFLRLAQRSLGAPSCANHGLDTTH